MNQFQAYLASVHPDARRVLGVKLQPFTLGHALLLHRLGSPFLSETPGNVTLGQLLLAIGLCRQPYERALRRLKSRPFLWHLRFQGWLYHWMSPAWVEAMADQFRAYLAEARTGPVIKVLRSSDREQGTPFVLALELFQMEVLHRTQAQARAASYREVLWLYSAYLEKEESISIRSAATDGLLERAKAERERLQREQEAKEDAQSPPREHLFAGHVAQPPAAKPALVPGQRG